MENQSAHPRSSSTMKSLRYQPGILRRHPANPVIEPADMPVPCSSVFNCGAVWHEGKVVLLLRVEDMERANLFHAATSEDGIRFTIAPETIDYPLRDTEERFLHNRFDMRITPLDGAYYVTHASWLGAYCCCIGIARTRDFRKFEAVGELSVPSNRNAAIFPEKINGRYARLERPQDVNASGKIWVSYSPDLLHWGQARPMRPMRVLLFFHEEKIRSRRRLCLPRRAA